MNKVIRINTIVEVGNMSVKTVAKMFKVVFMNVGLPDMLLSEMIDLRDALNAMINLQGEE